MPLLTSSQLNNRAEMTGNVRTEPLKPQPTNKALFNLIQFQFQCNSQLGDGVNDRETRIVTEIERFCFILYFVQ